MCVGVLGEQDGHPDFPARKSLQFVCEDLKRLYPHELAWARPERAIMFDDDGAALGGHDKSRLIKVPAYEYWEVSSGLEGLGDGSVGVWGLGFSSGVEWLGDGGVGVED